MLIKIVEYKKINYFLLNINRIKLKYKNKKYLKTKKSYNFIDSKVIAKIRREKDSNILFTENKKKEKILKDFNKLGLSKEIIETFKKNFPNIIYPTPIQVNYFNI